MYTSFKAKLLSVLVNVATHMQAYQSCDYKPGVGVAPLGVDGNYNGIDPDIKDSSVTHTCKRENNWWAVDLGRTVTVSKVALINRIDCCCELCYLHHN